MSPQWSVSVDSVNLQNSHEHPRAFLWIPSNCVRLRGVVVGQNNMLGKGIFQHPDFRKALTILGLAEIFIAPMIDTFQSATNIRSVANRWWYVARPSFPRLLQGCGSWEFARIAREWLSMAQIAVGVGDRTSAYTYRWGPRVAI